MVSIEELSDLMREAASKINNLRMERDTLLAAARRGVQALEANGAPNCEAAKELRSAIAGVREP